MGYEVVVLAFSSEDSPIWTMRPSFVIALPHLEWVDASRPSVETISSFEEGSRRYLLATRYERSASARQAALEAHGFQCSVCGFDFQQVYGDLGKGFIEVHHIDPVHRGSCKTNPCTDLIPLCSNCHSMIHRFAEFTPAQLRNVINQQRALIPAKAHNFIQTAVGFYTASHDRTVRIWDSRTGKPLLDPIKLPEKDSSACFAPDETFFVTESVGGGTGNGEVQLWDTETGRELCEPIVRDMDQDVSVHSYTSSDGRRLFAGLSGGHKQLSYISFDIPPSDQPMPAWLADLAEALGGFRLTGDNTLELLRVDQQNSILHNVAGNVSADHTDEWSAVVRWLLDYGKDAVVSPSSTLTIWALVSRDSSPTTGAPVRMDLLVHSPLNPKSPNPPV